MRRCSRPLLLSSPGSAASVGTTRPPRAGQTGQPGGSVTNHPGQVRSGQVRSGDTHRFLTEVVRAVDAGPEADQHVTGCLLTGRCRQVERSLLLLKYFVTSSDRQSAPANITHHAGGVYSRVVFGDERMDQLVEAVEGHIV